MIFFVSASVFAQVNTSCLSVGAGCLLWGGGGGGVGDLSKRGRTYLRVCACYDTCMAQRKGRNSGPDEFVEFL